MLGALKVAENFINVIRKAENANENELKLVRKELMESVKIFGAKNFVTVAADILKNNFHIEGCNDVRMPLKRIFTISLEELEEELSKKDYNLSAEHPVVMLSKDHRDNIKKLKALRFSFGKLNLNQETTSEGIKNKLKQIQDYYAELDLHIRKEEEVFFPALEKNGMQEHPKNLREEHKGFREILTKIIGIFKDFTPLESPAIYSGVDYKIPVVWRSERVNPVVQRDKVTRGLKPRVTFLTEFTGEKSDLLIEEVRKLKEKFISDISNHVFRETYIFYPAALEFITEASTWRKIKDGFSSIK